METWDEDDFNMEVQAFFEVDKRNNGEFQFDLVSGGFYGEIEADRLEFTWEGNDECDEASGSG